MKVSVYNIYTVYKVKVSVVNYMAAVNLGSPLPPISGHSIFPGGQGMDMWPRLDMYVCMYLNFIKKKKKRPTLIVGLELITLRSRLPCTIDWASQVPCHSVFGHGDCCRIALWQYRFRALPWDWKIDVGQGQAHSIGVTKLRWSAPGHMEEACLP